MFVYYYVVKWIQSEIALAVSLEFNNVILW